jgi:hypothetical protein
MCFQMYFQPGVPSAAAATGQPFMYCPPFGIMPAPPASAPPRQQWPNSPRREQQQSPRPPPQSVAASTMAHTLAHSMAQSMAQSPPRAAKLASGMPVFYPPPPPQPHMLRGYPLMAHNAPPPQAARFMGSQIMLPPSAPPPQAGYPLQQQFQPQMANRAMYMQAPAGNASGNTSNSHGMSSYNATPHTPAPQANQPPLSPRRYSAASSASAASSSSTNYHQQQQQQQQKQQQQFSMFSNSALQKELYSYTLQKEGQQKAEELFATQYGGAYSGAFADTPASTTSSHTTSSRYSYQNSKHNATRDMSVTSALSIDVSPPPPPTNANHFPALHQSVSSTNHVRGVGNGGGNVPASSSAFSSPYRGGGVASSVLESSSASSIGPDIVQLVESSIDEHPSEIELGNIHLGGHNPLLPPGAIPTSNPDTRPVPLYMRGRRGGDETQASGNETQGQTQQKSYASALRSKLPAPQAPEPSMEEEEEEPEDPLQLLRNLQIKASPATTALYQYFS